MRKRMMLAIAASAALAAALVAVPAMAEEKKEAAKDKSLQGEILDLACYIGHGASGPDHAGCAASCAKGGQPMGLLGSDGSVYVLLADHMDSSPYDKAKELAGKKAEVTGAVTSKGTMKGITVHGVKAL